MKKYVLFICLFVLLGCKKKDSNSILKYNQAINNIELTDKDYIILALDVVDTSVKEKENKEISREFKNEKRKNINLDSIFQEESKFNFKNNDYEIRILLQKINFKDSLDIETEKYIIMTLSSKEMNKGETNFKELLK